jgi:membrane protein
MVFDWPLPGKLKLDVLLSLVSNKLDAARGWWLTVCAASPLLRGDMTSAGECARRLYRFGAAAAKGGRTEMTNPDVGTDKRSGRRPEGPPHARKGSAAQTMKRTLTEFREDNLTDRAASLTYYAVLSIFPALVALVAIVGLVADPVTITRQLTKLVSSVGPASAANTFREPIASLAHGQSTAGILLVVGIAAALWTASGYVGAFMRASNKIYEVEEGRSIIKLRPLQMLVTLVLVVLLALVLVALVVTGPIASRVGSAIGAGGAAVTAWDIAKWPVLLIIVTFMIAVLYYASPNARIRGLKSIIPGSVLAVGVWLLASAAFAYYVANFGSYNKVYGALGAVVAFLVWLWISNLAILLGAEMNAERERSRQLRAGTPGAERELQLRERSVPKPGKRSRTA